MKLFDKVWNVLGLVDTDEPGEEVPAKPTDKSVSRLERKNERASERANKPVEENKPIVKPLGQVTIAPAINSGKGKIVLTQPDGFDDSRQIAEHLTNGKMVLVNFERTDADTTKRTIDFMSGITYAVGGTVQRISATIFLFAPPSVEVLSNDRFGEQV